MIPKPKTWRGSRRNRYIIYGVLIGIFSSLVIMMGEIIYDENSFTFAALIEHQRHDPTYWFLDTAPILLGLLGAWLGNREDYIASLSRETHREKDFFEALVNNSPIAIATLNADHKIIAINPAFEDLFGYGEDEAIWENLDDLVTDKSTHAEATEITKQVMQGGTIRATSKRKKKDGSLVDVEIHGVPVIVGEKQIGVLGLYTDISEKVKLDAQLNELLEKTEKLARTDVLTGLQNRRAIQEQAEAELNRSKREKSPLCLMLIDLDHLKEINDAFGHQAGDRAILHVARSLEKGKRTYDGVGRWGGDEMMLVLPNTRLEDAEIVANRLCKIVAESNVGIDDEFKEQITISVGIACVTEKIRATGDIDTLFSRADQALYDAKKRGRNQVCIFENQIDAD